MRLLNRILFLISLTGIVFASTISPQLEARLRAEGKWQQYIRVLQDAAQKGVNAPNKRAVSLEKLQSQSKETTYLNGLVILVDFADHEADSVAHSPAQFDQLLFSEGVHPTGSMNDYYLENSYGNVGATGLTTVWYRMPQSYTYYTDGQAGFGFYPNNAQKLVEDAIAAADADVDFSQYDNDGDGWVDALFVVHSGLGRETSGSDNDIHSHAWSISPQQRDGVTISGYSMEPELYLIGEMTRMGVFGHEFGHVLGLPDLYDTDYTSSGLGRWTMMAGGSWGNGGQTPSHFDAWCKSQLGWIDPVIVDANIADVAIPAAVDSAVAYRLWTEGAGGPEYFLLENRQQTGFDASIPNHGLIIYHVDETVSGNSNDWHPLVMVEQADGNFDLQNGINSGDGGDCYPGTSNQTVFSPFTNPNSNDYLNQSSFVSVTGISENNSVITANFGVQVSFPILATGGVLVNDVTGDNEGDGDPGETVYLGLSIANSGAASDSILVQLSSGNPGVTMMDSTEVVAIGADEEINLVDAFQVRFAADLPDPSYVIFDLALSHDSGVEQKYFTLLIGDRPGFSDNMEGDFRLWQHYPVTVGYSDEWHQSTARNHTLGGSMSYKLGGSGSGNYADLVDGALESPDIELGDTQATFKFYHKMMAEEEAGTGTAWDGGLLEISTDNGQSWSQLFPNGGYTHTIIENDASPFNPGTEVYSGITASNLWKSEAFDLSAYQGTVRIRFRFGSDGYVTEEGWYVDDITMSIISDVAEVSGLQPAQFSLKQNYPNPFNNSTRINFTLPVNESVKLDIYDTRGQKVKTLVNDNLVAGEYRADWDATSETGETVSSGLYFAQLSAGQFNQSIRILLIK